MGVDAEETVDSSKDLLDEVVEDIIAEESLILDEPKAVFTWDENDALEIIEVKKVSIDFMDDFKETSNFRCF